MPELYPPIPAFVVPEPAKLPSFPPPIQALDLPPALAPAVLLKPMSVPTLPQPIPALAFRGPATVPDLLPDLLPVPAPGALVPVAVPSIEPPGLLRRCLTSRTSGWWPSAWWRWWPA